MAAKFKIEGMKELLRDIKRLEQLPQKLVTKAARAGMTIAHRSAKAKAPVDIGNLQGGIILHGEKSSKPGKKMYDVMMNPAMNSVFVRMSADGTKRFYYPASMEYGFRTRDGGYVPGHHFLRNSIDHNIQAIEKTMVNVMASGVDKILGG